MTLQYESQNKVPIASSLLTNSKTAVKKYIATN